MNHSEQCHLGLLRRAFIFAIVLATVLGAPLSCGSSGDDSQDGDDDDDDSADTDTGNADDDDDSDDTDDDACRADRCYNPCDAENKVGEFEVILDDRYTAVQGSVADGVVPVDIPDVVQTDGVCQLLAKPTYFCDPPCDPGFTCNEEGICIEHPLNHNVGKVSVVGMKDEVTMEVSTSPFFYINQGTLQHPGFDLGAAIVLTAEGGDFEPFELMGFGIGALHTDDEEIPVEKDKSAVLSWTPPAGDQAKATAAGVRIKLNVNNHGSTKKWIECHVPDSGAFEIPAALITPLMDFGLSGFPTVELARRTVDSTVISPGCVELIIHSELERSVTIPDLNSCHDDTDCPPGQICLPNLTCG